MRIEQATKYRCDGCGSEQTNPTGWSTIIPMMGTGGMTSITFGSAVPSNDYCGECIKIMRGAAKASNR